MIVVHLPVYEENAYQPLLIKGLNRSGIKVINGGGGGRFLRIALTKWKPDIMHFHWLHPYIMRSTFVESLLCGICFILVILILRLNKIRIVWTIHNLQNHEGKHCQIENWITRVFLLLTDKVIVHCSAAEQSARRKFKDYRRKQWIVIPQGNYINHYPDTVSQAEARNKMGLKEEDLVLLFFGRIQPYKGILPLILAFRSLNLTNVLLIIAGKPADEDSDQIVRQAVLNFPTISYRPGFVPDIEIQTLMRASDVVVLPFRDILTSSSVLLAMSYGRTIIAPSLGCIPETVGAGHEFLYQPDHANGLAIAIKNVTEKRKQLRSIGEANYRKALESPWDIVARNTTNVYYSLFSDE